MSQDELQKEILEFEELETQATQVEHSYTADDIQVLEGLEAVRLRPGMYIGSTSVRGLHHLVWEIVDNGIDEALAGLANRIDVTIEPGDIIAVRDNGRGMPVGIHEKTGISAVETIMTVLHAGGKFGGGAYKVSGGLHGVGASVVNALSEWLEVTVYQDGKIYFIRFENGGHAVEPLKIIGTTEETGTLVRFKADPTIFKDTTVYDYVDGKLDRSKAYTYAENGIAKILNDNPSIEVVIDLHRDGVADTTHLVTQMDGKSMAKIMFFNGLSYSKINGDIAYLNNPYRDDNLAMSLQMQLIGEAYYPGFLRRIYVNAYRYCLHERGRSMLIEAGAQTNTFEEVKNAMEPLADILDKCLSGEKVMNDTLIICALDNRIFK